MPYDRSDYRAKWALERRASAIREDLGLSQLDRLEPQRLADAVPAHVFFPEDFDDLELARRVRRANWDGFAFTFPGEQTLIVLLNSARPPSRRTATLMEELAHALLGHRPCSIAPDASTGFLRRSYDKSQEHEAYDLGATLLLPKELVQHVVKEGRLAREVAAEHGCSEELVVMRIRRLRLARRYAAYAEAA